MPEKDTDYELYFICMLNTAQESISALKRWKIRGGEGTGGDVGIRMHGEFNESHVVRGG